VKAKMAALDAKIADYKQKHGDSSPSWPRSTCRGWTRWARDVPVEDQLRALKERESNLEQQLASVSRTRRTRSGQPAGSACG
jgi:hypothetical protein